MRNLHVFCIKFRWKLAQLLQISFSKYVLKNRRATLNQNLKLEAFQPFVLLAGGYLYLTKINQRLSLNCKEFTANLIQYYHSKVSSLAPIVVNFRLFEKQWASPPLLPGRVPQGGGLLQARLSSPLHQSEGIATEHLFLERNSCNVVHQNLPGMVYSFKVSILLEAGSYLF
jgi:hypothetical protein